MAKVDELLKSLPEQPLYKEVWGPHSPQLIAGFKAKDRNETVYEYRLDFDTGKLVSVSAISNAALDMSRYYGSKDEFDAALQKVPPPPEGFIFVQPLEQHRDPTNQNIVDGQLEAFESGLAKYREWAAKAQEMQPDPFSKEIPISREYGQFWPQFTWTNAALPHLGRRAKPGDPNRAFFDITFVPRRPDLPPMQASTMRALEPFEVDLLEGAVKMQTGPVEYLRKMAEAIRQVTQEQKQSVQDAFN